MCVNSLEDILLVLKTYKKIVSGGIGNRNKNVAPPNESGMMFTQVEENGRYVDKTNLHCYSCGINGHWYKECTQPWPVGLNTVINYEKNFIPPQPGTTWVNPMTSAPAGTQMTTASVVNVALDADTTEATAENNNAAIFDQEDVSFDQWLQLQSWKDRDEDRAQIHENLKRVN